MSVSNIFVPEYSVIAKQYLPAGDDAGYCANPMTSDLQCAGHSILNAGDCQAEVFSYTAGSEVVGSDTLVAGTKFVSVVGIGASAVVLCTRTLPHGANPGILGVSISPGSGFTCTSTDGADTGSFKWVVLPVAV